MNSPASSTLAQETIPPDEPEQIEQLIITERTIQEQTDRRKQPSPRNIHPKQHGCVRAELIVAEGIPERLRRGVFAEPRAFPAVVRFSSAKQRNDQLPDGHGVAIKLLDVRGEKLLEHERHAETQDFILIDHPVFFARNVAEMLPLMRDFRRLMTGNPLEKGQTLLKALFSPRQPFRILRKAAAKRPHSLLDIQYWSTTPYLLGEVAVKFSVRPRLDRLPVRPSRSPDKLRLTMVEQLRDHEVSFDFLVQEQTDANEMPIEDPTVEWDELRSPYRKVATLSIPAQNFDTPAWIEFGENLSFTPWHALPAHRPLGGINRARKRLYTTMSAHRHEWNSSPQREPTLAEVRGLL